MSQFIVINCPAGIFIRPSSESHPPQIIVGRHDTYEKAKEHRDALRIDRQTAQTKATDQWHARWTDAEEKGDLSTLLRLGHANK